MQLEATEHLEVQRLEVQLILELQDHQLPGQQDLRIQRLRVQQVAIQLNHTEPLQVLQHQAVRLVQR